MNGDTGTLVRLSGRYTYTGPVDGGDGIGDRSSPPASRSFDDATADRNDRYAANPIYYSEDPIYVADSRDRLAARRLLRLELCIDIDGIDPLNVVSGTVEWGLPLPGQHPSHLIGRVTSNAAIDGGQHLLVEDFSVRWLDSLDTVDRLEIVIRSASGDGGTAEATLVDTVRGKRHGPYPLTQQSPYFHDVEVDIDREDGAIDAEPYDTHAHPVRPADLPRERLTLQSAFAKAGIRIVCSPGTGSVLDTSEAGEDHRWSYRELHDSMSRYWDAYANRPQWKLWIFLAELADDETLGGVMFDGDIDEPGGVDRQGTAVFTLCPFFHTEDGAYVRANPPTAAAFQRELFFNLMHEAGHAFNLAHSFQKTLGSPWTAPHWMSLSSETKALSWMNYPDQASAGLNTSWFYERFRFRFEDHENLFLRHAPEWRVQMGNESWFQNHGRVSRSSLDRRLQLVARTRRPVVELGENAFIELRLTNLSDEPLLVHPQLDPSDGLVEIAITDPRGQRRPLLPVAHHRRRVAAAPLESHGALYHAVNATMGHFGFHFKEPGAYRVEASYSNVDGGTAAAVTQILVKPPANDEDWRTIAALFNARVGRAASFDGTRVMEDVNERLDWVLHRLGEAHPARHSLAATRYLPLARRDKLVEPGQTRLAVLEPDPGLVYQGLKPLVSAGAAAADALGHINYRRVIDRFAECSVQVCKRAEARQAQEQMLDLFVHRAVIPRVIEEVQQQLQQLK